MNRMTPSTISAGAVTAAVRLIVSGNAWPIIPPPAATSTRKNVPSSSENSRRHSCFGSRKFSAMAMKEASIDSTGEGGFFEGPDVFAVGPAAARFLFCAGMEMMVRANHPAGFIRKG